MTYKHSFKVVTFIHFQIQNLNIVTLTNNEQHVSVPALLPRKKILFYNPAFFQLSRHITAMKAVSTSCGNNCDITFDTQEANRSDAVIINPINMKIPTFTRPREQIWIMIQHEAPVSYSGTYAPLLKVILKRYFKAWEFTNI